MPDNKISNQQNNSVHKHLKFDLSNNREKKAYDFLELLRRCNVAFISELIIQFLELNGIDDISSLTYEDAKKLANNLEGCFSVLNTQLSKEHVAQEKKIHELELKLQGQAALQQMIDTLTFTNQQLMTMLQMQSQNLPTHTTVAPSNVMSNLPEASHTPISANEPAPVVTQELTLNSSPTSNTSSSESSSGYDSDTDEFINSALISGMDEFF